MKFIFKADESQFLEDGEDKEVTIIAEISPHQKQRIYPAEQACPEISSEIEDVSIDGEIADLTEKLEETIWDEYERQGE